MFELSRESPINKVRRYPMRSSSKLKKAQKKCYSYGYLISIPIIDHIKTCIRCQKIGQCEQAHLTKSLNEVETTAVEQEI